MNRTEDNDKQHFVEQLSKISKLSVIINLYPEFINYGINIYKDENHFNEQGHKIIADALWRIIYSKWFTKDNNKINNIIK